MKRRRVLTTISLTAAACAVLDHAHGSEIPCRCKCHGFMRRLWARITGEPAKPGAAEPVCKPKINPERDYPQCERCGFAHIPVDPAAGFCCICGKRPARLPYGWCAKCTEEALDGPPDDA